MRLLRSTAFNIIMFGSCTGLSLYGLLVGRFMPGGALSVAKAWGRICIWALRVCCGIPLEVEGLEHIPEGGVVIAAQHQSALDILIWLAIVKRPSFVFKRELKRVPVFGSLLEPSGMIPVNRGGGGQALREMVTGATAAVAAGRQLVIFPEGTRVAFGTRGQIRNGVVMLTQNVNVPVLPAATNAGERWGRKAYDKTPGPVHLTIYPALPAGLSREEIVARLEDVFYGPDSHMPVPAAVTEEV
jgi:1-acyl-sn-glycerol-3-phosphate acyltransferase